jgi:hypothetical protein
MRINKMQKFCNGAIHRTNTEARHRARANVRTASPPPPSPGHRRRGLLEDTATGGFPLFQPDF